MAVSRWNETRRVAVTVLCALWWGGFSFYAARVVFIGHTVLKSRIRQGFITERVTAELNWLGLFTLAFVGWEFVASRQSIRRRGAYLAWAVGLIATLVLFPLHARLAAMLDFSVRIVTDDGRFYGLHRVYLVVAATQWLAGLICLVSLLRRPESQ
ncbi:MAG TPA: hypothetical protein VGF13_14650 [Verrucomicrobiae bacterium]|jgi:hypothetical protein